MMDIQNLAKRLQGIEHFNNIPLEEVERIILAGMIKSFAKDQLIFSEEEPSAGMYVLLNGQVQLCKISLQGQISILSVINPVIMFNEVSALDNGPNCITAIANQDSLIWQINSEKLQGLIMQYPRIGLGLLQVLAKRNRKLISLFQDLSFRPLLSRTAKLLLEISDQGTQKINRKDHPNYHLASRLSTVPEAFSRCLKTFRHQNMIVCDTHKIEILDPLGLKHVAKMDLDD
jgi:CRP/FNR family transcriptional regulator